MTKENKTVGDVQKEIKRELKPLIGKPLDLWPLRCNICDLIRFTGLTATEGRGTVIIGLKAEGDSRMPFCRIFTVEFTTIPTKMGPIAQSYNVKDKVTGLKIIADIPKETLWEDYTAMLLEMSATKTIEQLEWDIKYLQNQKKKIKNKYLKKPKGGKTK